MQFVDDGGTLSAPGAGCDGQDPMQSTENDSRKTTVELGGATEGASQFEMGRVGNGEMP